MERQQDYGLTRHSGNGQIEPAWVQDRRANYIPDLEQEWDYPDEELKDLIGDEKWLEVASKITRRRVER